MPAIIDSIASFAVAGFILHAAYEIFIENSGILLDKAAIDNRKIETIVLSYKQVKDAHGIRSRGYGNALYIDMHIMTEPEMSVEKSHELIHNIEERIRLEISRNIQVIAHFEPYK